VSDLADPASASTTLQSPRPVPASCRNHEESLDVCRAIGVELSVRRNLSMAHETLALVAPGAVWILFTGNVPPAVPGLGVRPA
jgi:hypothetical protein